MNILLFIRLSIPVLKSYATSCKKTALQNLYVSLVRLKPYNSDYAFCNSDCDNWAET
jgi:hypothetical protein